MLWISVNCWHSSEIDEVVSLHGSELEIYFRNIAANLEVVNGKDRLFLIHLNHHFVPSVVVQILIWMDQLSPVFVEFKPEHKLPVFKSEFEVVILTAVVGVKQKPIFIPGLKLKADGAVQTSLPARVLRVRILGPVHVKGGGGGDAQGHQDQQRRESKE